jgi:membrane protein DedA with SNARE-associated domain
VLPVLALMVDLAVEDSDWIAYITISLLIIGDAIIPILPGETTLVAGAAAAAAGELELYLVIIFGALGAIVGDSCVFWIGHRGHGQLRAFVADKAGEDNVQRVEELFVRRGVVVVIFGRWIPGLRMVVSLTAGGLMPYRKFLPLSIVGGFLWATQSSLMAYFLGKALGGFWASLFISLAVSTLVIAFITYLEKRRRKVEAAGGAPVPAKAE